VPNPTRGSVCEQHSQRIFQTSSENSLADRQDGPRRGRSNKARNANVETTSNSILFRMRLPSELGRDPEKNHQFSDERNDASAGQCKYDASAMMMARMQPDSLPSVHESAQTEHQPSGVSIPSGPVMITVEIRTEDPAIARRRTSSKFGVPLRYCKWRTKPQPNQSRRT